MKRILAVIILLCTIMLFSCTKTRERTENQSSAEKKDTVGTDAIEQSRPIWEGILYAAYSVGNDTESNEYRAMCLAYILSHYSYGELTTEPSHNVNTDVSATRAEIQDLFCACFGFGAPFDDEVLKSCFDISDDTFTLKQDVTFTDAEYGINHFFMSGDKAVFIMKAGDKSVTAEISFAKNSDVFSPYTSVAESIKITSEK